MRDQGGHPEIRHLRNGCPARHPRLDQAFYPHELTCISRTLPAEETGGGKLDLLDAGAYKEMDACLMYVDLSAVVCVAL